jgi:hypothetical protein
MIPCFGFKQVTDEQAIQKYEESYGIRPRELWVDVRLNLLFTIDTSFRHNNYFLSVFVQPVKEFRLSRPLFDIANDEFCIDKVPKCDILTKFKGSKVLVLGGGPSALQTNWSFSEYDFVFSCNNFYKNEEFSKNKIDLAIIGNEVNLLDLELIKYLEKHKTITLIEQDHACYRKVNKRSVFSRLRYNGRIGSVPRLILYAIFFGASEIHITGMDGPNMSQAHAFQAGKKASGTIETFAKSFEDVITLYQIQYFLFWSYVFDYLKQKIVFKNLSEDIEGNMLSEISKKCF